MKVCTVINITVQKKIDKSCTDTREYCSHFESFTLKCMNFVCVFWVENGLKVWLVGSAKCIPSISKAVWRKIIQRRGSMKAKLENRDVVHCQLDRSSDVLSVTYNRVYRRQTMAAAGWMPSGITARCVTGLTSETSHAQQPCLQERPINLHYWHVVLTTCVLRSWVVYFLTCSVTAFGIRYSGRDLPIASHKCH